LRRDFVSGGKDAGAPTVRAWTRARADRNPRSNLAVPPLIEASLYNLAVPPLIEASLHIYARTHAAADWILHFTVKRCLTPGLHLSREYV